jgi:HPt (histidine-containing phosphotransfer) domain-containing protein
MDPEKMREMLAGIWEKHKPEMEERLAVLERTCRILGERELSAEERTAAVFAAHKLAGALGTFGRTQGSDVARTLEHRMEGLNSLQSHLPELLETTAKLREIVTSRT